MRDTLESQPLEYFSLHIFFYCYYTGRNAKFYLVPKRPLVTIAVGLEDSTQSGTQRNSFEIQNVMLGSESKGEKISRNIWQ